ncbi:hypothetical protein [uncultured Pseudokineococcus sp.]|nr:hypothetical protein [uncultured Pseudokineococcus sp.]
MTETVALDHDVEDCRTRVAPGSWRPKTTAACTLVDAGDAADACT